MNSNFIDAQYFWLIQKKINEGNIFTRVDILSVTVTHKN